MVYVNRIKRFEFAFWKALRLPLIWHPSHWVFLQGSFKRCIIMWGWFLSDWQLIMMISFEIWIHPLFEEYRAVTLCPAHSSGLSLLTIESSGCKEARKIHSNMKCERKYSFTHSVSCYGAIRVFCHWCVLWIKDSSFHFICQKVCAGWTDITHWYRLLVN